MSEPERLWMTEATADWLSGEDVCEVIARAVYHHAGLPTAWALLGDGQASWLSIAEHVVVDLLDHFFADLPAPAPVGGEPE